MTPLPLTLALTLMLRQTVPATAAIKGRIGASRVVGQESYYMGIVDFQQQYTLSKKVRLHELVSNQHAAQPNLLHYVASCYLL
mgnify:FL=1